MRFLTEAEWLHFETTGQRMPRFDAWRLWLREQFAEWVA